MQGLCWQHPSTHQSEHTQLLCQPTGPKGPPVTATYRLTGRAHPSCEYPQRKSLRLLFSCRLVLSSSPTNKQTLQPHVNPCSSSLLTPPDLESTIVCNCSNVTRAPSGNHENSAPVCKNKTKVQQPLYYYYYYATFSNVYTKAAFVFIILSSVYLPTSHYGLILFPLDCLVWIPLFFFFLPRLSFELQKGLSTNRRCRSVAPVFVLCWCVCSPPAAAAAAQFAGKYWTSSSSSKTID